MSRLKPSMLPRAASKLMTPKSHMSTRNANDVIMTQEINDISPITHGVTPKSHNTASSRDDTVSQEINDISTTIRAVTPKSCDQSTKDHNVILKEKSHDNSTESHNDLASCDGLLSVEANCQRHDNHNDNDKDAATLPCRAGILFTKLDNTGILFGRPTDVNPKTSNSEVLNQPRNNTNPLDASRFEVFNHPRNNPNPLDTSPCEPLTQPTNNTNLLRSCPNSLQFGNIREPMSSQPLEVRVTKSVRSFQKNQQGKVGGVSGRGGGVRGGGREMGRGGAVSGGGEKLTLTSSQGGRGSQGGGGFKGGGGSQRSAGQITSKLHGGVVLRRVHDIHIAHAIDCTKNGNHNNNDNGNGSNESNNENNNQSVNNEDGENEEEKINILNSNDVEMRDTVDVNNGRHHRSSLDLSLTYVEHFNVVNQSSTFYTPPCSSSSSSGTSSCIFSAPMTTKTTTTTTTGTTSMSVSCVSSPVISNEVGTSSASVPCASPSVVSRLPCAVRTKTTSSRLRAPDKKKNATPLKIQQVKEADTNINQNLTVATESAQRATKNKNKEKNKNKDSGNSAPQIVGLLPVPRVTSVQTKNIGVRAPNKFTAVDGLEVDNQSKVASSPVVINRWKISESRIPMFDSNARIKFRPKMRGENEKILAPKSFQASFRPASLLCMEKELSATHNNSLSMSQKTSTSTASEGSRSAADKDDQRLSSESLASASENKNIGSLEHLARIGQSTVTERETCIVTIVLTNPVMHPVTNAAITKEVTPAIVTAVVTTAVSTMVTQPVKHSVLTTSLDEHPVDKQVERYRRSLTSSLPSTDSDNERMRIQRIDNFGIKNDSLKSFVVGTGSNYNRRHACNRDVSDDRQSDITCSDMCDDVVVDSLCSSVVDDASKTWSSTSTLSVDGDQSETRTSMTSSKIVAPECSTQDHCSASQSDLSHACHAINNSTSSLESTGTNKYGGYWNKDGGYCCESRDYNHGGYEGTVTCSSLASSGWSLVSSASTLTGHVKRETTPTSSHVTGETTPTSSQAMRETTPTSSHVTGETTPASSHLTCQPTPRSNHMMPTSSQFTSHVATADKYTSHRTAVNISKVADKMSNTTFPDKISVAAVLSVSCEQAAQPKQSGQPEKADHPRLAAQPRLVKPYTSVSRQGHFSSSFSTLFQVTTCQRGGAEPHQGQRGEAERHQGQRGEAKRHQGKRGEAEPHEGQRGEAEPHRFFRTPPHELQPFLQLGSTSDKSHSVMNEIQGLGVTDQVQGQVLPDRIPRRQVGSNGQHEDNDNIIIRASGVTSPFSRQARGSHGNGRPACKADSGHVKSRVELGVRVDVMTTSPPGVRNDAMMTTSPPKVRNDVMTTTSPSGVRSDVMTTTSPAGSDAVSLVRNGQRYFRDLERNLGSGINGSKVRNNRKFAGSRDNNASDVAGYKVQEGEDNETKNYYFRDAGGILTKPPRCSASADSKSGGNLCSASQSGPFNKYFTSTNATVNQRNVENESTSAQHHIQRHTAVDNFIQFEDFAKRSIVQSAEDYENALCSQLENELMPGGNESTKTVVDCHRNRLSLSTISSVKSSAVSLRIPSPSTATRSTDMSSQKSSEKSTMTKSSLAFSNDWDKTCNNNGCNKGNKVNICKDTAGGNLRARQSVKRTPTANLRSRDETLTAQGQDQGHDCCQVQGQDQSQSLIRAHERHHSADYSGSVAGLPVESLTRVTSSDAVRPSVYVRRRPDGGNSGMDQPSTSLSDALVLERRKTSRRGEGEEKEDRRAGERDERGEGELFVVTYESDDMIVLERPHSACVPSPQSLERPFAIPLPSLTPMDRSSVASLPSPPPLERPNDPSTALVPSPVSVSPSTSTVSTASTKTHQPIASTAAQLSDPPSLTRSSTLTSPNSYYFSSSAGLARRDNGEFLFRQDLVSSSETRDYQSLLTSPELHQKGLPVSESGYDSWKSEEMGEYSKYRISQFFASSSNSSSVAISSLYPAASYAAGTAAGSTAEHQMVSTALSTSLQDSEVAAKVPIDHELHEKILQQQQLHTSALEVVPGLNPSANVQHSHNAVPEIRAQNKLATDYLSHSSVRERISVKRMSPLHFQPFLKCGSATTTSPSLQIVFSGSVDDAPIHIIKNSDNTSRPWDNCLTPNDAGQTQINDNNDNHSSRPWDMWTSNGAGQSHINKNNDLNDSRIMVSNYKFGKMKTCLENTDLENSAVNVTFLKSPDRLAPTESPVNQQSSSKLSVNQKSSSKSSGNQQSPSELPTNQQSASKLPTYQRSSSILPTGRPHDTYYESVCDELLESFGANMSDVETFNCMP